MQQIYSQAGGPCREAQRYKDEGYSAMKMRFGGDQQTALPECSETSSRQDSAPGNRIRN
jgi:hypothetical protein